MRIKLLFVHFYNQSGENESSFSGRHNVSARKTRFVSFYIITEKKCIFLALSEIKLVYLKRIKYYLLIKCIAVYE